MKLLKQNKGVIIFYLVIAFATLIFIQYNSRNINMENGFVYLTR